MTEQEAAYCAGRTAYKSRTPATANPHPKSLFDKDQLWDAWTLGWTDGRDAAIRNKRKRQHAWNRA